MFITSAESEEIHKVTTLCFKHIWNKHGWIPLYFDILPGMEQEMTSSYFVKAFLV